MVSLALSIGLIASLNRSEESTVPSLPLELTITPTPFATVDSKIPARKVAFLGAYFAQPDRVCVAGYTNIPNLDVVTTGGNSLAGIKAESDIIAASCECFQCTLTL